MPESLVLAGDIGGTKSNLGFYTGRPEALVPVAEQTYLNRGFTSLADVIRPFLLETGLMPSRACLAVAGAVIDGRATLPNLGWQLSAEAIGQAFGIQPVILLNDLEANALGVATLGPGQFHTLNPGRARPGGNQAILAAGTGLGMALMWPGNGSLRVAPSEGGHGDFAPRNEREVALWRWLSTRHGHVSLERVVSGQGLVNIYGFLKHSGHMEPDWLSQRFAASPDPAAVIAQAALAGEAPICAEALDMFLSAYGAAAGNLALTALASGGLYLGGGIAPRLVAALPHSGFMGAFTDKGRFAPLLRDIPVQVILEPRCALRGAAARALAPDAHA